MNIMIINDTHLGVKRQTGTTQYSRQLLQEYMFALFDQLLTETKGRDLLILGDLFDGFNVAKSVEIKVFAMLKQWADNNQGNTLYLVAGNHDLSTDSANISSFENLCVYLREVLKDRVVEIRGGYYRNGSTAVVPHMPNQKLFDAELDELLASDGIEYVLLHCNYDNHFAKEADHSLNVSAERAAEFAAKGIQLVFAHEHKPRDVGNCRIIGNQIPSSIADCLDNDIKRYATLGEDGLTYHTFGLVNDIYREIDWKDVHRSIYKPFVRVTGTAEFHEAAEVLEVLSEARKLHPSAYVIGNAVKVGNVSFESDTPDVLESIDIYKMVTDGVPRELSDRLDEVMNYYD